MTYMLPKRRQKSQSALQLSRLQRSHLLLILSNATQGKKTEFVDWGNNTSTGEYR